MFNFFNVRETKLENNKLEFMTDVLNEDKDMCPCKVVAYITDIARIDIKNNGGQRKSGLNFELRPDENGELFKLIFWQIKTQWIDSSMGCRKGEA